MDSCIDISLKDVDSALIVLGLPYYISFASTELRYICKMLLKKDSLLMVYHHEPTGNNTDTLLPKLDH